MADRDYYAILQLPRSATSTEVKQAFRRLALQYHPDKNTDEGADEMFAAVCESFDTLDNASNRAIYDQYGYAGLRNGAPSSKGQGFTQGYAFHGDSRKVFREFFGGDNPFNDLLAPLDEFNLLGPKQPRSRLQQDKPVEEDLSISLEEAYSGCVKKMRISRKIMNDDGYTSTPRDKILTINVKKGWKEGTKVTFPKEWDQTPNSIPADVVFVIKYKPHALFTREGNNLVYTAAISLSNALAGCIMEIQTLDGRCLNIRINDVVHPAYEKRVPGEGMPVKADGATKGDMIIRFKIQYPTSISEEKKILIRQALE